MPGREDGMRRSIRITDCVKLPVINALKGAIGTIRRSTLEKE
jgi:hypothetical protein